MLRALTSRGERVVVGLDWCFGFRLRKRRNLLPAGGLTAIGFEHLSRRAKGLDVNIVLIEPEIPQNTGNIARTCACVGATLHLVEPMGFRLTQRNLARAGCDYWDEVDIVRWSCADEFLEAHASDELHLFTGRATRSYTEVVYGEDAFLLFGRESAGIDPVILDRFADQCVRIPMREGLRSLNLSNAVAIAAYEALRQRGFAGLV